MLQPFVVEVASESDSGDTPPAVDGRGQLGTHPVAQLERALEVGGAATSELEVGTLLPGHRLGSRPRQRPVRARVHIRDAFEHGELRSGLLECHSIVTSTGAWSD